MESLCIKDRCKTTKSIAVTYGLQENSKKDVERQFQNLATDTIRNQNQYTIILGDLNAKHKLNKENYIQQKIRNGELLQDYKEKYRKSTPGNLYQSK